MALRSLTIELGLADDVSNKLRAIDNQIDGMESGLVGVQDEFDALETSTKEYARVAGKEIEGIEDDVAGLEDQVDAAADATKDAADVTARSAKDMAESWGKVGAAVGAAGIATEAYLRSQQDMYFAADKIAYITGMDRREVIGLAADLNDLSTSLKDAYGVMEIGAKQGLMTKDELTEYVQFWSSIATVSGEDATNLARLGMSLRSVGIEASNIGDASGVLGFTLQRADEEGVARYLDKLGDIAKRSEKIGYNFSVEDTAIMLAAVGERGIETTKAVEHLESAMTDAKGDTTSLFHLLGITEDQVGRLSAEINEGADYIASMNDSFDKTRTPLQGVQTEVGKLAHTLGNDFNPLIEAGSLAMTGASSVMLTAASAAYLYSVASTTTLIPSLASATASAWAFTTALLANPLTWIVVGIVALGAALYLLASNWDDISGWFMGRWEQVGSVATGAISWIGGAWDSTVGRLVAGAEWLMDHMGILAFLFPVTAPIAGMNLLRDNWDSVTGAIAGGWDLLVAAAQDGAAWLGETIGAGLSGIIDLFWQYHPLGIVIRQWDEITGYLEGIDLVETGRDILLGLVWGILDIRQQAIDAVMGIGEDILNAVTAFFGISSPSKLMQEMGGHVGEGFALGVAQSMPESIPLPEMPAATTLNGEYATACTELAIKPLTGSVQYSSAIAGPDVPALTGELTYETRVSEPTIVDRAGTVVYETEMSEPTIAALTGAITYVATVLEPAIPLLTGAVTYLSEVLRPEVPALAGTIEYGATLPEQGNLDRAGEVRYTPTIAEPAIDTLAGMVEYRGVLVGLPDINDLTGRAEFGGREIDDTRASTGPETDNLPDPIIYTPERDAPYMAGERSGDLVYSPTIHVTTGTSDANEIATTVDRRLRQTFDRHAELYFARQRRRAAL